MMNSEIKDTRHDKEPPASVSNQKTPLRAELPQVIAVLIKNILIVTLGNLYGYVTILIPNLSDINSKEPLKLNAEEISWIGSINMLSVSIGCLSTGFLTTSLGRKQTMQLITVPLIFSWIIIGFADRVWHLNFALFLCGFCSGVCKGPIVSYAAEISEPKLRGMLTATSWFSFIFGMILQYIIGSFCRWRALAFINCFVPTSGLILLFFVPESPYWLLMNNKFEEAQKSLAWLRGWTTVDKIQEEYITLRTHCISSDYSDKKNPKFEDIKSYLRKSFLWPLSLVTFMFLMGNLSGTSALMTYAVKIFENLRVPINKFYAVILLGVVNIIGCAISVGFIRYTGKRWMAFISLTCVGICSAVIGIYTYHKSIIIFSLNTAPVLETNPNLEDNYHQWIPLVFLLLTSFAANFGVIPIGLILIGEVFSKQTRSTGSGIASAILHIIGFVVNKLYLRMIALLTIPGMYWFYSSICLFTLVSIYFILPETEGRTLQEIEDHFSQVSKLQNDGSTKYKKPKCVIPENKNLLIKQ